MTPEAETVPAPDSAAALADVLIVASWFPAVDDLAAGRFVADQAEALAGTGRVRVAAVSFDGIRLSGGATARGRQAAVASAAALAGIATEDLPFVAPAVGVDGAIPVARLAIPDGQTTDTGVAHAAIRRGVALGALGERLVTAAGSGPGGLGTGVVHAHTAYPDGAAAVELADRLGWPLLITEHSSFVERFVAAPELRGRYAAALARCHRLFAVSEMLAGELRTAFPEHAARIAVLPNAVPIERFAAAAAAERDPDELLFVGYRKASKGIENLLRAFAVARVERPGLRLRLLGRSPDETTEDGWRRLAGELGVADGVTFEDPIDRAGVAAAMGRAALFVHPSPRETFGVVAVEALASGTPVVATDSGGVTEILGPEPERLGAIVAVDDPAALGGAIVATLARRDAFDPAELRAAVERRFGAAYVAERLLVEIREALAGRGGAAVATPAAAWAGLAGAPAGPIEPPIVVALDRERAASRLASLPSELRAALTVVTAAEPRGVALAGFGRVLEVAVETGVGAGAAPRAGRGGTLGRLERLARDPLGTVARRLGRGTGSASSLEPVTTAIREILAASGDPPTVLPLDGHDHLAVAPLVGGAAPAARLDSGGIRRLADRWAAAARR